MTKQEQHILNVISACNHSICDYALHISAVYNSRDPFECVSKMSDQEWTALTTQPAGVRSAYLKVMSLPSNRTAAGIVELQFCVNADKQASEVAA